MLDPRRVPFEIPMHLIWPTFSQPLFPDIFHIKKLVEVAALASVTTRVGHIWSNVPGQQVKI